MELPELIYHAICALSLAHPSHTVCFAELTEKAKILTKDGYVHLPCVQSCRAPLTRVTAGTDMVITDVVATRPPHDVMEPHGSNPFAIADGAADQPEKHLSVVDEKILEAHRPSVYDPDLYPKPTDEERTTLRKVADSIPNVAYWLCCVEFAERASYYGVQTVFSNFIEFPLPAGKRFTLCVHFDESRD